MDAVGSSMTTLPKGKQVIGIIFRLAMAKGIPTIVMACAAAVVTWPMASHRPATTEPHDVHERRTGACARLVDDALAEGPQHVSGDAEAGYARGDRDDEDAGDDSREEVAQEEREPSEEEPDDVEQGTHGVSFR